MPLFARRDIQDRINALGDCLPADQIAVIVERLNNHQRDRMAALWEVVMLQAFSTLGTLTNEAELGEPLAQRAELLSRFMQAAPHILDLCFGEEHRLTLCRAYAKIESCQTPQSQR